MFYGNYEGKVVDNNDPTMSGRIKVICPEVLGVDIISHWIPSSENHSGQLMVPEVGDIVNIICKNGDPNLMRYISINHSLNSTPSSARNEISFANKGNSSFKTCGDYEIVEPPAPERSQYPGVKTILENQNSFVELDDNGRFQYYNKKTNHFMEWHPDGTLVIKAKRIYIETTDETEGLAIKTNGRFDISCLKDMTLSVFNVFHLWVKNDFLKTIKENLSVVVGKIFSLGSSKGIDLDTNERLNIVTRKNMIISGKNVDIVSFDDME